MGRQEEERLEMTNGNGGTGGGRPECEVSPPAAQDPPEMGVKGKGTFIFCITDWLKGLYMVS